MTREKAPSLLFYCLVRNRWKPIKLFVFFFLLLCWWSMSETRKTTLYIYMRKRESYSNGSVTSRVLYVREKEMDARIEKKKARAPPNIICNTLITMTTTTTNRDEREIVCQHGQQHRARHQLICSIEAPTTSENKNERKPSLWQVAFFFLFYFPFSLINERDS
jgi:hypothetical protein